MAITRIDHATISNVPEYQSKSKTLYVYARLKGHRVALTQDVWNQVEPMIRDLAHQHKRAEKRLTYRIKDIEQGTMTYEVQDKKAKSINCNTLLEQIYDIINQNLDDKGKNTRIESEDSEIIEESLMREKSIASLKREPKASKSPSMSSFEMLEPEQSVSSAPESESFSMSSFGMLEPVRSVSIEQIDSEEADFVLEILSEEDVGPIYVQPKRLERPELLGLRKGDAMKLPKGKSKEVKVSSEDDHPLRSINLDKEIEYRQFLDRKYHPTTSLDESSS